MRSAVYGSYGLLRWAGCPPFPASSGKGEMNSAIVALFARKSKNRSLESDPFLVTAWPIVLLDGILGIIQDILGTFTNRLVWLNTVESLRVPAYLFRPQADGKPMPAVIVF
jgi:hypothetical protein